VKKHRIKILQVTDTGAGVSDEIRHRIFEPFFTTKEANRGTGLGLATVYGVVKQNNGDIQIQSKKGEGTTFRIYLPRVKGEDAQIEVPAKVEMPTGSETILLVEDDMPVREVARTILEGQGYTVLEAEDGFEALDIAGNRAGAIDLLLVDVVMPKMSGQLLVQKLLARRPNLKVLYMSGYTGDAITQHGALGANFAFIQKPFSPAVLARKVREVLDA
jgi:CheY-like chemotaxis protein